MSVTIGSEPLKGLFPYYPMRALTCNSEPEISVVAEFWKNIDALKSQYENKIILNEQKQELLQESDNDFEENQHVLEKINQNLILLEENIEEFKLAVEAFDNEFNIVDVTVFIECDILNSESQDVILTQCHSDMPYDQKQCVYFSKQNVPFLGEHFSLENFLESNFEVLGL